MGTFLCSCVTGNKIQVELMLSGLWCQICGRVTSARLPGLCPGRPWQLLRPVFSVSSTLGQNTVVSHSVTSVNILSMDRHSPLLQAVRSQALADDSSMVTGDVRPGDISAIMTYDQMSYLLTMMITVTVISVIILIVSVSAILAFLW